VVQDHFLPVHSQSHCGHTRCCRRRRARQRPRPHENDRARASLDHPWRPRRAPAAPGVGDGGAGGGQVTNSRSHTEASPWLRPEPEPAAALGWLHTAASPWLRPESLDHPCRPRRAPAAPRGGGQVTNSRSHTAASPWLRPEADQSAALSGPAEREETRASSNAESTGRK